MTIPTKEAFEEYFEILAGYEIDSLLKLLYRRNFDQDELMRIFEILEHVDSDRNRESSHRVAKWLSSDHHFRNAEQKMIKVSRLGRTENYRDEIAAAILEIRSTLKCERDEDHEAEKIKNDENLVRKNVHLATAELRHILWKKVLIESLIEFHFTKNAEEMVTNRKRLPKEITKFQSTMLKFTDYLQEIYLFNPDITSQSGLHSHLKGLARSLDNLASQVEKIYPINRVDATSGVRLFILRMSAFHLNFYSKKYADVVTFLIGMDGIDADKEVSDVEKLCVRSIRKELLEEKLNFF